MLLIYSGAHPEVYVLDGNSEVPLRTAAGEPVENARQGEPVEVPDAIAVKLLEQSTWSKAPEKSTPSAKPTQAAAPATTTPGA